MGSLDLAQIERKQNDEAGLSESLVASIATVLSASDVRCVLWGQFLLRVHGIPSIVAVCYPTPQTLITNLTIIPIWISR